MTLKKYKKNNAGRRFMISIDYRKDLDNDLELPNKLFAKKATSYGRNNDGRITVRHRCGGAKKHYRIVDFKRDKKDIEGEIKGITYDPNRTSFIALVQYKDGEQRFILAPDGLKKGDVVISSNNAPLRIGNTLPIKNMQEGQQIHNIECSYGRGGSLVRSAGSYATVVSLKTKHAQIRMPSGEIRLIPKDYHATIGVLSNSDNMNTRLGKAGKLKYIGRRPEVKGMSMNAADHPHGGGKDHQTIGKKYPTTPKGKIAIGGKTRKNKRTNSMILKRRNYNKFK